MKFNKKKIKNITKNFTLELLELIKILEEMIPEPFESPYEHQKRLQRMMGGSPPQKISQTLYKLKKRGLIDKKLIDNRISYHLTITGQQKLLISKISQNKLFPKDGTSCIIVFDIPEEKKRHRKFLRKLLLNNGFINLQKSVLIGPGFLSKDFLDLLDELGIRQNVTIIKGSVLYQ